MKYIVGHDNWTKAYTEDHDRDRIWIYFVTSDNKEVHLQEYDHWLTVQEYLDKNNLTILKVGLRYRSHLVKQDASKAQAVYVIRSVKGEMYGVTKECYTIGLLDEDGKMHKTMWMTPALVEEMKTVDSINDCFEKAIVYNVRQGETVQ
jgi:hypothetical protein